MSMQKAHLARAATPLPQMVVTCPGLSMVYMRQNISSQHGAKFRHRQVRSKEVQPGSVACSQKGLLGALWELCPHAAHLLMQPHGGQCCRCCFGCHSHSAEPGPLLPHGGHWRLHCVAGWTHSAPAGQ